MDEELNINREYAEKYNKWREKEELQKLKDRYGDLDEADLSGSSSETEDEEAEGLTPQVERDWLRTLSAIKNKDPSIYKKDTTFYNAEEDGRDKSQAREKQKKSKPVLLKDLERQAVLKKSKLFDAGEEVGSSSEEENEEEDVVQHTPGYYEEQEEIRSSFMTALEDLEEETSDIFTVRQKSKDEQMKEEVEYLDWLKGQRSDVTAGDQDVCKELAPLKDYIHKPDLGRDEKFVWNYILNKQYLAAEEQVPSYDEITGNFSEEEDILQKQDDFERGVNFRYEDPDPDFIKRYPRYMSDSMRRQDTSRATKRQEVRTRKDQEKDKKREELKRLKNLKRREIEEKIEHLKEVTGNPYVGFTQDDLNEDFDPKKHDRLMKKVFDNDYYNTTAEYDKPVFSDNEELGIDDEQWDQWQPGKDSNEGQVYTTNEEPPPGTSHDLYCEDPEFNMDADYDPDNPAAPSDTRKASGKKRKRKSKFAQVVEKQKPIFDPEQGPLDDYIDEYYALDYEDLIGDLPCRFKYRKTIENDFGLTTDEVLTAKDKELNQWVSLKKMTQYRTEEEEMWEKRLYRKKSHNPERKMHVLTSLTEREPGEEGKTKRKRKRRKGKGTALIDPTTLSTQATASTSEGIASQKSPPKNTASFSETVIGKSSSGGDGGPNRTKKRKKSSPTGSSFTGPDSKQLHTAAGPLKTEVIHSKKSRQSSDSKPDKKDSNKTKKRPKESSKTMSEERLKAYGINPKKFKYTYGNVKSK